VSGGKAKPHSLKIFSLAWNITIGNRRMERNILDHTISKGEKEAELFRFSRNTMKKAHRVKLAQLILFAKKKIFNASKILSEGKILN